MSGPESPAREAGAEGGHRWGLCASCLHHRVIESKKGSQFVLCERSRTDPIFPRYPPLPVVRCVGWERAAVQS